MHEKNKVELNYVKSQDEISDIFIKPLKIDIFNKFRSVRWIFKIKGGVTKNTIIFYHQNNMHTNDLYYSWYMKVFFLCLIF